MKKCTKCGELTDNFRPDKIAKDGLCSWCKICHNAANKEYQRTKEGLCAKIYSSQRQNSKRRGDSMPEYTSKELKDWIYTQSNFEELYTNWVNSEYETMLVPSCDRLDDYEGYNLDNIRLVTWAENNKRSYKDRKNGINNKQSTSVIGTHKDTGEIIEFHSQHEASRITGISQSGIWSCCNGKLKSAGAYKWIYTNNNNMFEYYTNMIDKIDEQIEAKEIEIKKLEAEKKYYEEKVQIIANK